MAHNGGLPFEDVWGALHHCGAVLNSAHAHRIIHSYTSPARAQSNGAAFAERLREAEFLALLQQVQRAARLGSEDDAPLHDEVAATLAQDLAPAPVPAETSESVLRDDPIVAREVAWVRANTKRRDAEAEAQREREAAQEADEISYLEAALARAEVTNSASRKKAHGRSQSPARRAPTADVVHSSCPVLLRKFRQAICGFAVKDDVHSRSMRDQLWALFDTNRNGRVSLAQCNGGIMSALTAIWKKQANMIFKRYYRSYIRAFEDAKVACAARIGTDDDEVVSKVGNLLSMNCRSLVVAH